MISTVNPSDPGMAFPVTCKQRREFESRLSKMHGREKGVWNRPLCYITLDDVVDAGKAAGLIVDREKTRQAWADLSA